MKRASPGLLKFYREGTAADASAARAKLAASLAAAAPPLEVAELQLEECFNIQLAADAPALSAEEERRLMWLLAETFEPQRTSATSFLRPDAPGALLEFGPRLTFATAFSSNAVSICAACGLSQVVRIERSRRLLIRTGPKQLDRAGLNAHAADLYDEMTEDIYHRPLESLASDSLASAKPVVTIPLLAEGRAALERASEAMGLGFDSDDLDLYTKLFVDQARALAPRHASHRAQRARPSPTRWCLAAPIFWPPSPHMWRRAGPWI